MPINWDDFDKHLDKAIKNAGSNTDDALAAQISSLTRMTDAEVKELFPDPADIEKLAKLMKTVKSSQARNEKVNHLVANAEQFSGIILTLLNKFI